MEMNAAGTSTSIIETDFLLIGGGIAAVTAAQTLRNEGAEGSILMLCAEPVMPYNCPLLTKNILTGELSPDQILLLPPEGYRKAKIDIRLNSPAGSVHPFDHRVVDGNGGVYRYGKLLIASGARPQILDAPGARLDGIFQFRTLADALSLREWIATNRDARVVVVGTSFIGMELATSLVRMGVKITMIDQAGTVFPKIHSPMLSSYFFDRCKSAGIDVLLREEIKAFHGETRVAEVETLSGLRIPCGSVVLAIGVVPQTGFLEGTGLRLEDGIVVDEFLQTSARDVFAAGDVAAYPDGHGVRLRTEHWDNAHQQGHIAAKNMLGQRIPYQDVPHYFCEFLDFSFTFLGTSEDAELRVGRGSLASKSFAEFYLRDGAIIGLFATGRPAEEIRIVDTLIRNGVDVGAAQAQLADPATSLDALARQTVLILQGGGALGAFECGVLHAMNEAKIVPDVVGGVSIGAINGAIIASNPNDSNAALDAFWNDISVHTTGIAPLCTESAFAMGSASLWGIPGFFLPRWLCPGENGEWWPYQWTSIYSTSPFKDLLGKYVDFSRLKTSPVRLIVGAVDVELGELTFFDSRTEDLTVDHLLASGSLPPMFPWMTIAGRRYWDGGIISNSPLEHVLMRCGADNKQIIIVDLFPGKRPLPRNLAEVLARRDEITYGERIRNDAQLREFVHEFQALVSEVMLAVDPDTAARLKERPRYVHLMGGGSSPSIIRIVRAASEPEPPGAEYDFSMQAVARHKREGYLTSRTLLAQSGLFKSAFRSDIVSELNASS